MQTNEVTPIETERWHGLRDARIEYTETVSEVYDEVLQTVSARFVHEGSIGKAEIGGLLLWKRLRADTKWSRKLMDVPDAVVRHHTSTAYVAANDESLPTDEAAAAARSALGALPGFKTGDALASAVLVAAAPERLAVYDRRAHRGLGLLGFDLKSSRGRYGRYMRLIEDLRSLASVHGESWKARDVDLALYWLGGKPSESQALPDKETQ